MVGNHKKEREARKNEKEEGKNYKKNNRKR